MCVTQTKGGQQHPLALQLDTAIVTKCEGPGQIIDDDGMIGLGYPIEASGCGVTFVSANPIRNRCTKFGFRREVTSAVALPDRCAGGLVREMPSD